MHVARGLWPQPIELPYKHTWCTDCSDRQTSVQTLSSYPCTCTGGPRQTRPQTPPPGRTSWPAESQRSCRDRCRTGDSNRPAAGAGGYHKLMADTPASSNRTPRTASGKIIGVRIISWPHGPSGHPYQALARLAPVDPLLAALELYVFEFLVRAHFLFAALRTARVLLPAFGAVARSVPARDYSLITSTYFARLVVGHNLPSVRNLNVLKHAAYIGRIQVMLTNRKCYGINLL